MKGKPLTAPAPTCLASLPSTGASCVSRSLYLTGRIWSAPHTWTQPADHYCNNPQSRAVLVLHTWKCHTIQEWLNEIGVQSISGVTTNERKVKENRPDRGIVMLNWTPYLGICQVQGHCWPNGHPKQDCIVVHPPSNIMEVKKKGFEIERCVIFHHTQQTCLQIKTVSYVHFCQAFYFISEKFRFTELSLQTNIYFFHALAGDKAWKPQSSRLRNEFCMNFIWQRKNSLQSKHTEHLLWAAVEISLSKAMFLQWDTSGAIKHH